MQLLSVSSSRGSGAASPRLSSSGSGGVGSSLRTQHSVDATPDTTSPTATTAAPAAAAVAAGANAAGASSSSDSNSDWDEWSDTEKTVSIVCLSLCLFANRITNNNYGWVFVKLAE